jgi:hypothetical protein
MKKLILKFPAFRDGANSDTMLYLPVGVLIVRNGLKNYKFSDFKEISVKITSFKKSFQLQNSVIRTLLLSRLSNTNLINKIIHIKNMKIHLYIINKTNFTSRYVM